MHMSDALLSVPVAGSFLGITLASLAVSARMAASDPRAKPARMGVLGAFVFAAQMINFSIPGTGSSGHFAGGTLLALLIGPWAGAIVMASVLAVQALFFADGGLLAWGANVFNMGLIGCFVAGPLVVGLLSGPRPGPRRRRLAVVGACVTACVGGALCVTLQTAASGLTDLPFWRFAALMLPVHAAIGVVEGLITASALEQLKAWQPGQDAAPRHEGRLLAGLAVTALLVAGTLSWFASQRPDGLEYSIGEMGAGAAVKPGTLAQRLQAWQSIHAPMPDYDFRKMPKPAAPAQPSAAPSTAGAWPKVQGGTSLAGLGGALVVGLLALLLGGLASLRAKRAAKEA